MSAASPRVNSTLLANFMGRSVTVVGKRTSANGHIMHIEGPDGGDIMIDRSVSNRPIATNFVEVVGVVGSDRTVRESRSTDFGNDFGMVNLFCSFYSIQLMRSISSDLKMYNELVLLSNGPLKGLFM